MELTSKKVKMHISSKWLIAEAVAAVTAGALLRAYGYPLLLSYDSHKLLHIIGVVLLLGNVVVTAAWMLMAERTKDGGALRFASRATNWADVFFTVPGVFLIFTNGDILSVKWGGAFKVGWITYSLLFFAFSGVLWVSFLLRYQWRLIGLSEGKLTEDFFAILHKWYFVGALATIILLVSLALMVFKPSF